MVALTKNGGYDAVSQKAFLGQRMQYWPNFGGDRYWGTARILIDMMKSGNHLSVSDGHIGPNVNGYYDMRSAVGSKRWSYVAYGIDSDSNSTWLGNGVYVLRWKGDPASGQVRWGLESSATWCDKTSETNYLHNGQTETDYDSVVGTNDVMATGAWAAGSGYVPSEVITLSNGALVTVNTVDGGGGVLTFSVNSSAQTVDSTIGAAISQSSSSGSGSGFSLTPQEFNIWHRIEYTVSGDENRSDGSGLVYTEGAFPKLINLIQPGQEARLDAGNVIHQDVVDSFGGGRLGGVRTMGFQKTNNSIIHNYADWHTMDDISWVPYVNPRVCAKLAKELECGLWWCAPGQACHGSYAALTSAFNDIIDEYPAIPRFMLELGNETWAASAAFKDTWRWLVYGNVTPQYPVVDSATGIATLASHGFSFATSLGCFSWKESCSESAFPFGGAGVVYAMAVTTNTFKMSQMKGEIQGITNANPCVVTLNDNAVDQNYLSNGDTVEIGLVGGMTELNGNTYTVANIQTVGGDTTFELQGIDSSAYGVYTSGGRALKEYGPTNSVGPLNENVQKLLVKNGDLATQNNNYWAGKLSADIWDVARPIFGADVFRGLISGQRANAGVLSSRLAAPGCGDNYDFATIASYYKYLSIAGPRDFLYNMPEFSMLKNQDQTAWDGVGDNGSYTQGSGYVPAEQITIDGGAVVTVNTVGGGGEVLTFSLDRTNDTGNHGSFPSAEVLSQQSSTGSGSGFSVTTGKNNVEDITTNRGKLDWMMSDNGPLVLSQQQDNINAINAPRLINYEGADHQGSAAWPNDQQGQAIYDWGGSPEAGLMDRWWGRQLAFVGIKHMAYHTAYSGRWVDGVWGMQYYRGDDANYKYVENNFYFMGGGAPPVTIPV